VISLYVLFGLTMVTMELHNFGQTHIYDHDYHVFNSILQCADLIFYVTNNYILII